MNGNGEANERFRVRKKRINGYLAAFVIAFVVHLRLRFVRFVFLHDVTGCLLHDQDPRNDEDDWIRQVQLEKLLRIDKELVAHLLLLRCSHALLQLCLSLV